MRKLIYGGLLLAFVGIGIIGCKKDSIQKNVTRNLISEPNASKDGKTLVFESIESFEKTINDLTEKKIENLTSSISKNGYNNYFSIPHSAVKNDNDSIQEMDEVLGQLLNEDGVIQIENHIYKVDLEKESVYVITVENKETNYLDLINGNTSNKNVTSYSINQDVLHLVNGEPEQKCGGVGGGSYSCYPNVSQGQIVATLGDGSVWRLNPGVKFFKAGIYFRLSSLYDIWAFPSSTSSSGNKVKNIHGLFTVEIFCRYPQGWYKKKPCGGGDVGTQAGGFYYSKTLGAYQQTFYSGIRNLNGYYFYIQGRVKYPNGSVTIASPYGGRNINSPY